MADARLEALNLLSLFGSQDGINLGPDPGEQQRAVPLGLTNLCRRGADRAFVGGLRHPGIVKGTTRG